MHLDGRIVGDVRSDGAARLDLVGERGGSIEGTVEVPNVMLEGTVKGDIHARGRVVLGATRAGRGHVHYGVIEMTLGAQIMGKLVRLAPEVAGGGRRATALTERGALRQLLSGSPVGSVDGRL